MILIIIYILSIILYIYTLRQCTIKELDWVVEDKNDKIAAFIMMLVPIFNTALSIKFTITLIKNN